MMASASGQMDNFVGRVRESGILLTALDDAFSAKGRVIMLGGEPGVGKTRLAEELTAIADSRNAVVLWGRCFEEGGTPPYWPWIQALRAYVRKVDSETLLRALASGNTEVAELVPDIRAKIPDIPSINPMELPDANRFKLFNSISTFLKNASPSCSY